MARIRQIKPEFYLDDELAQRSRDARLLFPGLWILADRAGSLENRPAKTKAQVFPYDCDIDAAKVRDLLAQLEAHRFILIYEIDGKSYIQIRTFEKHQHCHRNEVPSQIPGPDQNDHAWDGSTSAPPASDQLGPNPERSVQIPSTRGTCTSTSGEILTEDGAAAAPPLSLDPRSLFLIFWECYPLKVKKPKAEAAFLKLKPDRELLDRMLEAIDGQKQTAAWRKNNGQFIPHPATWLNNRQWEDEVSVVQGESSVWSEFIGETGEEKS